MNKDIACEGLDLIDAYLDEKKKEESGGKQTLLCGICFKSFCEHIPSDLSEAVILTAFYDQLGKWGFYADDGKKVSDHGSYPELFKAWLAYGADYVVERDRIVPINFYRSSPP